MNWLYVSWLLMWNFLRIWPGERWWTVAITNYFAPWFMISLIPITILMLALRQKKLFFLALITIILMFLRFTPLFQASSITQSPGSTLKVMTFNLNKHNREIDGIASLIHKEDPDIVAFQELAPEMGFALYQKLGGRYLYFTFKVEQLAETLGLLSKFEISEFSGLPNSEFLSAVVNSPHGEFTLINVHAPKISPYNWKRGWEEQNNFIQELVRITASIQGPILLVGDFNLTYLSENYDLLSEDFHDTFLETGFGFGFTFPTQETSGIYFSWPLVRIDYIFHNDYLFTHETRVLTDGGGSDHRPVVSILSFTE